MESAGKRRGDFTIEVSATDQILPSEDLAREAEVQGLGFVVVAGFEPGGWKGEEVAGAGSMGRAIRTGFWCTIVGGKSLR